MKKRFKLPSAVHLFLIKGNNILLLRRFNTGYRDGEYSVPAGHIDGEESARAATQREALEETGVKVDINDLDLVHTMHLRAIHGEWLDLFFKTEKWQNEPQIMEPDKCDELKWFPLNALPVNVIPYIRKAVESYANNQIYSEFGWITPDEE